MTREDAESASAILKKIKEYEDADNDIRRLHKEAVKGDLISLDKLASISLMFAESLVRELEEKLAKI